MDNKTPKRKRRKRRVKEPLTEELLAELLNSPDPAKFASQHRISQRNLPDYLQQLLDEKDLHRPDVVRRAQIGETYGYYIFTGQRHPKRDFIIRLALAMECSLTEANRLLQAGGLNELYCKNRRDAMIIFCLTHGYDVQQTNDELYRFNEETLSESREKPTA